MTEPQPKIGDYRLDQDGYLERYQWGIPDPEWTHVKCPGRYLLCGVQCLGLEPYKPLQVRFQCSLIRDRAMVPLVENQMLVLGLPQRSRDARTPFMEKDGDPADRNPVHQEIQHRGRPH